MSTFYLYFSDGKKEKIEGENIGKALRNTGRGDEILKILSCVSENDDYVWNEELKEWEKKINTYYLYWKNGRKEKIEGTDIWNAAGHLGAAEVLEKLGFYSESDNYVWNEKKKEWEIERREQE